MLNNFMYSYMRYRIRFIQVAAPVFFACLSTIFSANILAINKPESLNYQASDYFSNPMLPESSAQKIMLVHIDQSSDMLERAYSSSTFDASSSDGLTGYFDSHKQYRYNKTGNYFEEDDSLIQGQGSAWDGQFLNWLVMRKLDLQRLLLIGSGVQTNQNIIELARNSAIKSSTLRDPQSKRYSPVPGFMPISLKRGQLEYQNKTVFLRIKGVPVEKGLMNLIGSSVALYFYSNNLFGDQKELLSFLKNWTLKEKDKSKYDYHATQVQALQKALESIKTSTAVSASANQVTHCQRYVHLNLPHSSYGSLVIKRQYLKDCQPNIPGKQTLKPFEWGYFSKVKVGRINTQNSASNVSVFNYSEKEQLFRAMFDHLFSEEQSRSTQITGADLAQFSDGVAVIYQSLSQYAYRQGEENVNWSGDLRATLVDKQGRLRSDNGDKKLGSLSEDPLVFSCFDDIDQVLRFRLSQQHLPESNCTILNYPHLENDIGYLWRASNLFNHMSAQDRLLQRSPFQRIDDKRYIRTHIGQQEYDFIAGESYPLKTKQLKLSSDKDRDKFIDYVRGEDQENKRSRRVGSESFLLGDTFKNAPAVVGQPSGNYHLLYGDNSYHEFLKQYQSRRSRVFIPSQNGILHSFNAGWYDEKNKQISSKNGHLSAWALGQEIWAFVPYSALPYLAEQQNKFYGISPERHFSLYTQKPYVFDAKVFGVNALAGQPDRAFQDKSGKQISTETHPGGWGTIMVVGVGLGDVKLGGFKPSYLVFDITDAEQAPMFLASIEVSAMGSAISQPSVITHKNSQGKMDWHLVLGSGADLNPEATKEPHSKQSAGVYLYNLKSLHQIKTHYKPKYFDLKTPNAFVAGMSAADWNLNGETDALYVNTISQKSKLNTLAPSAGNLHRVTIQHNSSSALSLKAEKIFSTDTLLQERPQLSLDRLNNRWVYIVSKDKIVGFKEPRDVAGNFLNESSKAKSGAISENSLLDVTGVLVNSHSGELGGVWALKPALSDQTVLALERRMLSFNKRDEYISGWLRLLDKNEVPNGSNKLFGGMLSQASFEPHYSNCQLSTSAFVHRLRFTTGTAWLENVDSTNVMQTGSPILKNTQGQTSDSSVVNAILLHSHGESVRQLKSSKHGKTKTSLEGDLQTPISAEISWREL